MRNYPEIGLQVPDILIAVDTIAREKWAVVACDQYTSQPEYWDQVSQITDGLPSTYHLILPEAFLGKPEEKYHQSQIKSTMSTYLHSGLFQSMEGLIYVERNLGSKVRQGLIAALDLERYDFQKYSQSLIRATEGTIIDRLPPRIIIRENAPLEIPHIMVLIDDPLFTVIEPLSAYANNLPKLYDFELMMGGGHLKGYLIHNPEIERKIVSSMVVLACKGVQKQKYQLENSPLLYAVGDGNHSLATAKSFWEKIKDNVDANHPARYALVEIVNIHNEGIAFEPIHRLIKNFNTDIFKEILLFFSGKINLIKAQDLESMVKIIKNQKCNFQLIGSIFNNKFRIIEVLNPLHTLAVGSLQLFLDDLIRRHPEIDLDFIHGEKALFQLGNQPDSIGFYLPAMEKSSLFKSVVKDGPLPRKTFSMGEAHEKRFYFECRKIQVDE
ncbi:MAG: DUF1015 domain-containing protein [Pelolinea sp.]|nr:DUF1015 domain-containing protein [Pelolinea sp.]